MYACMHVCTYMHGWINVCMDVCLSVRLAVLLSIRVYVGVDVCVCSMRVYGYACVCVCVCVCNVCNVCNGCSAMCVMHVVDEMYEAATRWHSLQLSSSACYLGAISHSDNLKGKSLLDPPCGARISTESKRPWQKNIHRGKSFRPCSLVWDLQAKKSTKNPHPKLFLSIKNHQKKCHFSGFPHYHPFVLRNGPILPKARRIQTFWTQRAGYGPAARLRMFFCWPWPFISPNIRDIYIYTYNIYIYIYW